MNTSASHLPGLGLRLKGARLRLLKCYVLSLRLVRRSALGVFALALVILFIGLGALTALVALCFLLPLSGQGRLRLLFGLGAALALLPLAALWYIMREAWWLNKAGVNQLLLHVSPETRPKR